MMFSEAAALIALAQPLPKRPYCHHQWERFSHNGRLHRQCAQCHTTQKRGARKWRHVAPVERAA